MQSSRKQAIKSWDKITVKTRKNEKWKKSQQNESRRKTLQGTQCPLWDLILTSILTWPLVQGHQKMLWGGGMEGVEGANHNPIFSRIMHPSWKPRGEPSVVDFGFKLAKLDFPLSGGIRPSLICLDDDPRIPCVYEELFYNPNLIILIHRLGFTFILWFLGHRIPPWFSQGKFGAMSSSSSIFLRQHSEVVSTIPSLLIGSPPLSPRLSVTLALLTTLPQPSHPPPPPPPPLHLPLSLFMGCVSQTVGLFWRLCILPARRQLRLSLPSITRPAAAPMH